MGRGESFGTTLNPRSYVGILGCLKQSLALSTKGTWLTKHGYHGMQSSEWFGLNRIITGFRTFTLIRGRVPQVPLRVQTEMETASCKCYTPRFSTIQ